ncbi:hypothetical protein NDU88_000993 [Pleurodeles waltl]|uniref:Gypsy retrotransposon integrase-like protein 1 n=1 Tax=Pleurodeles waltl TaxID=8319 RepID=A0AAV7R7Q8_PLEWA|nr:hypothetical protein NDU88_000993 [Pleurodeles waltl]
MITLSSFYPPPHSSKEEERLHRLDPRRALSFYVDRTRDFRLEDQLFIGHVKNVGTDVGTSARTSYCLYDIRRRRVGNCDVLVDVQKLGRRFPETTEAVLVSEGAIDLATLVACPLNMDKYKQLPLINGIEVQAYRDTGASVTMVIEKLVHPEQHLLCQQYQVTDAHYNTLSHPMAVVNRNREGVTGPKKVVVASDLPVDCLLRNDLETSAWAEVALEAHASMLGIPGPIFALTRAQAKKQKGQGNLDPGTMDQVLPKARGSKGKSLPTIPPSTDDSPSEEEEFPPCAEPSPDELAADTDELLVGGRPAREELSVAQQTCPTLEGLRQQAVKQQNADVSDSHRVYWEDNPLYTEARDPKPGAARRLVIPLQYREFLLTLAHDIPLAGHLGQIKTWEKLVPLFHWPRISEDTKDFCKEVPQKGVGFSPFELLFGHPVRGPLTLVKEGWEQPLKAPKQDIVDYVLGLRSRMAEYMKKASKNLHASQELQKQWHDQKAVLIQYQPGQKVWVLEPVAPRALQDKWSGPHLIVEKKGEVTFLVDLGTAGVPLG